MNYPIRFKLSIVLSLPKHDAIEAPAGVQQNLNFTLKEFVERLVTFIFRYRPLGNLKFFHIQTF